MLQPANRLTLIDAMRPPTGFSLEHALAVSYTLDLRALISAPAAFALGDQPGSTHDGTTADEPIELLHAVRRYSDRITVFNQVGAIALPPSRKVFAFLEGCIVPVRAPRGGVVHPKVWVLRYVPTQDDTGLPEAVHRVLIASRNLTFDESWDTIVRLDETFDESTADLSELADLFEGLSVNAVRPLTALEQQRVALLTGVLRGCHFATPSGVRRVTAYTLGLGPPRRVFPRRSDRSLVISPFLTDGFFADIAPGDVTEVVSRSDSLDSLGPATLARMGTRWVFDDQSLDETPPADDQLARDDPGRPLRGLHAKIFVFEKDRRVTTYLGSANATTAAFTSNVEVLLECEGQLEDLGIDALLGGNDEEGGLRRLFVEHLVSVGDSTEPETDSRQLDQMRDFLARCGLRATIEQTGDGWATTYRSEEPLPHVEGMTVHCWPLAVEASRRSVPLGEPLQQRFVGTLESISGFLAVEVQFEGLQMGFVVPVVLDGLPEERDTALMRALIGNAERFFRYLLAFLEDDLVDAVDTRSVVDRIGGDSDGDVAPGLPVLERLLRTVRRDPQKLKGLSPLVQDLSADGILPDGFMELWSILEYAGGQREGGAR